MLSKHKKYNHVRWWMNQCFYCDNHFTIYVYHTIILYILNFHNTICQLYLNKAWWNKRNSLGKTGKKTSHLGKEKNQAGLGVRSMIWEDTVAQPVVSHWQNEMYQSFPSSQDVSTIEQVEKEHLETLGIFFLWIPPWRKLLEDKL